MIQEKLEPDFTLDMEVERNWREIVHQWYQFDRLQKEAEMIKTITLKEISDWMQRYIYRGKNYRKLTIKVKLTLGKTINGSLPDSID